MMSWNSFYLIPCKETPYSAGFKSLTYYRMLLYMFSKNGLETCKIALYLREGITEVEFSNFISVPSFYHITGVMDMSQAN